MHEFQWHFLPHWRPRTEGGYVLLVNQAIDAFVKMHVLYIRYEISSAVRTVVGGGGDVGRVKPLGGLYTVSGVVGATKNKKTLL